MHPDKTIIFALESKEILSSVLRVVNLGSEIKYIIASRITDVISILKTVKPALIICGFYNNQEAIFTLSNINKDSKIPLLCLIEENERLRWDNKSVVFTQSLYASQQENVLTAFINSILLLLDRPDASNNNSSLLGGAAQRSFVMQDDKLCRYVMELEKKKSILINVKKRIKELYQNANSDSKNKLFSLMNMIKNETSNKNSVDDFDVYFNKIRPTFLTKILNAHPKLTSKDIRYCCYLSLNMSNNEIRNLLGINQESVRTHQYRLKKKLSLPKSLSLREYVHTLSLTQVN